MSKTVGHAIMNGETASFGGVGISVPYRRMVGVGSIDFGDKNLISAADEKVIETDHIAKIPKPEKIYTQKDIDDLADMAISTAKEMGATICCVGSDRVAKAIMARSSLKVLVADDYQ